MTKLSSMLEGYKVEFENNDAVKDLKVEDGSFALHLESPENIKNFVAFITKPNI